MIKKPVYFACELGGELNENVLAFFIPGGAGTPYRRKLEIKIVRQ